MPAVVAVKGGNVVNQFVGLRDAEFLEQFARDVVDS